MIQIHEDAHGPKISIVIAAYNAEKYLPEAIESCLKQTYGNIEIVAVDDGSKDSSGEILEQYAKRDPLSRIVVIHHEKNKGLLSARCTGVGAATGEYLIFLDGDDYLEPHTCEDLVMAVTKVRVDVLQFGTNLVDTAGILEDHLRGVEAFCTPFSGAIDGSQGCLVKACFGERKFGWNVWNKLWNAAVCKKGYGLIQDMRLIYGEDTLGCFVCFLFARNYASISDKLYNYRQGTGITAPGEKKPNRIPSYGESYRAISEIERICVELGYEKRFENEIDFVRRELSQNMAWYYEAKIGRHESLEAFEKLLDYWPTDVLIPALTVASQRDNYLLKEELLDQIYQASCFRVKTEKVKTVGMFYYRYYNGGVERVASGLSKILTKAGYQVVLFADEEENKDDYPFPDGTPRIVLPKYDPTDLKSCMKRMQAWKEGITKYHVDSVIYHAWVNNNLIFEEMAIRSTGVSLIIHSHGDYSQGLKFQDKQQNMLFARQKKYYRLANAIVALSEMDQYWWRTLGYNCVSTINPVPFDCETTKPSKLEGKNVLWVGRLCDQKQPVEALKIMEVVHESEPDAVLHMVGQAEDWMDKIVRDYIKSHDMTDYVMLEGFTTNVAPFYQNSAVMLWTAYYEGMPVGMMESKVFGLPLVTYEIPNLDMIRHPKGAVVTAQKDFRSAAQAVVSLLRDEAYRKKLGSEARVSGAELTSFDIAAHWEKIFVISLTENAPDRLISEEPVEVATIRFLMESIDTGYQQWADCVNWQSGQIWNYQHMTANTEDGTLQTAPWLINAVSNHEEALNRHEEVVNRHEEVVNRHEEVVNRHEEAINNHWEIQQWHTDWLNGLEARMNAVESRNVSIFRKILRKLKRAFTR